jgi:hypothetical protein
MGHKSHLNGLTTTVGRGTNYSLVDNRSVAGFSPFGVMLFSRNREPRRETR